MAKIRALLCVLALALCSIHAHADDVADEADLHFQVGAEAYAAGDYRKALEHFLRSNRLVKNRNVMFNIARCYEQLGRYPAAWRSYTRALEQSSDAAFRAKIDEALARIAPNVGVIAVTTDPPGATVYVDRKNLGARGEAPQRLGLAPGKYTVIVEKDGYEPERSEVLEIKAGETRKLSLRLVPILGEVRMDGAPVGAEIRVDTPTGKPAARLPATLSLPPGEHRIYVSQRGKRTEELNVDVRPKSRLNLRVELDPLVGNLVVSSDLRDALIEVDGKPVGFTPAVVPVQVGTRQVRVSLSGFREVERTVVVQEGKQTSVNIELAREEQVTAASRTEERVEEAPSSVTIIPRDELRAMGYQTIAEAVRGVRGLYITDDRSYTTIGVRGFSRQGDYGNKVLILYDGHPYNENILGQSFPGLEGLSSLDDVQRIEVVRGPGSVLYGTGAFFGVINLVTHDRDGRTRAEAGAATHEYGVVRGRGFGYVKFEDGGFWNSVQTFQGPGRDFYFPEYRGDPSGLDGHSRGIDGVYGGSVHGRVWWKDLTLQWLWHQREKELPTGEYEVLFGDPRNIFIDKRGFAELRYEPKLGDSVALMTRAHANLYTFESTAPYDPADGGVFREEYQGRWVGLEQRVALTPIDELRLTLGAEVQRHLRASMFGTDEFGDVYLPEDQNPYWSVGVYGLTDADLTRWLRVSAGVRFDAFRWEFAERNVDSSSVNPRAALIVKPYESGVSKLMVGKAFRAPSIYERFYQSSVQATSLDLDPEQVWSAELEHTHRFSQSVVGTGAVFTNYVTGLVVGRGDGTETDPFFFVNSPTPVLTLGGELEMRREWRDGWMLGASYSVQRSEYVDPAPEDGFEEGAEVPNSPTHLGAIKGAVPIVGRSLMAMSRFTFSSKRYDRNETVFDDPQSTTGGAIIWDLVFSGIVMDDRVRYNFGFYNINDWRYRAPVSGEFRMLGVPQNGRTMLAGVTLVL